MPRLALGTFNIRLFPDRETVPATVAERWAELDADVVMVQEIRVATAFDDVLAHVERISGRRYVAQLGPMCASSQLQLGVVYDPQRVTMVAHRTQRELDPQGRCSCRDGHPPALLAVLDAVDGGRVTAMSVHLQFGARRWQYRARRDQWDHLVASIERVEAEFGGNIVVAGDFNSTGYATDDGGEQSYMRARASAAGLVLATADVGCTAYWRPNRRRRDYVPSILDHVLCRSAPVEAPQAMGMCAALGGRACTAAVGNPDFHAVSDHCPLRWTIDV